MEGAGNMEVQPTPSHSTRPLSSTQPSFSRPSFSQPTPASLTQPSTSQPKILLNRYHNKPRHTTREFYRNHQSDSSNSSPNGSTTPIKVLKPSFQYPAFTKTFHHQNSPQQLVETKANNQTPKSSNKDPNERPTETANARASQTKSDNGAIPKKSLNITASPKRSPKKHHERNGRAESGEPQRRPFRHPRSYDVDEDACKKVVVVGFPAYSRIQDIVDALSVYGEPMIQVCKNRVAVALFSSEPEARAAIKDSGTVTIYGEFVNIYKYFNYKHVMDLIKSHRRVMQKESKGPDIKAPNEIDLTGDFYAQVRNIEDAIRLTQEEVRQIGTLFADIEAVLKPLWPSCRAIPFGSITTGLGIKTSDADCFLELAAGRGAGAHSGHFVRRAAKELRAHPALFAQLVPIPRANTPIIKFLHLPTNVNCDLNSKTPLGAQNSRLIRHLLSSDARLGPVALLLKYWARVHGLSGSGRLTNYALLMLLLAYLQGRGVLPPVHKLQVPAYSFEVESWDAGFDPSPLPPAPAPPGDSAPSSMRDLLGGFFLHYARFNFDELVVSPFMGEPLRKTQFEKNMLPEKLARYTYNIAEKIACPLRTNCAMCVQDPFELSHNVASPVTQRLAQEIKAYFNLAAAAYTRAEPSPGDFLRRVLVEKPPPADVFVDPRTSLRMSVPGRDLADLDSNWKETARDIVISDVFDTMLLIQLTRRHAVSREKDVELEVYGGVVTRPVWKRGQHSNARCANNEELLTRHRRITQDIINATDSDLHVPFEVEFGFRRQPRGLSLTTTAMDGADQDAFRDFRKFVHNFVHRWFRTFLKPHLKTAAGNRVKHNTQARGNSAEILQKTEPREKPHSQQSPLESPPSSESRTSETDESETNSDESPSVLTNDEIAPPVIDFINTFLKRPDVKVQGGKNTEKVPVETHPDDRPKLKSRKRISQQTSQDAVSPDPNQNDLLKSIAAVSLADSREPATNSNKTPELINKTPDAI